MSAGLSALSNDELMQQLAASRSATVPAPSVSGLSDDELMRQLGRARQAVAPSGGQRTSSFDKTRASASFDDRFGDGPTAATLDTSTPLGAGLRRVADEELIGKPGTGNAIAAGVLRAGNTAGLNLPRNVAAGIATGLGAIGVPGYGDRSFSENYALAKDQEEALARQNPKSAVAGTAAGIGAGALALPATPLIGGTGMAARVGQGFATGVGYGAAGEYLDNKDPLQTLIAAGAGGVIGGAAVPAIEAAAPIVAGGAKALYGMVSRGVPVTNESGALTQTAKALLRNAGVPAETLTPEVQAGIGRAVARKGESEAAIREALADEFGIPLSRGQATGDASALSLENAARGGVRGDRAREVAQTFDQRQGQAIEAAGSRFADRAGRGVSLDNPQQASEVVADQAREYARRVGLEADDAQRAADEALAGLRGGSAVDQVDAGAAVAQGLRGAAARNRGQYKAAYDEVAAISGEFAPGALDRIGATVRKGLAPDVPVDDVLTPAASRALRDLDNLPDLFRVEPGAGPNLQQVEQVRKRLGSYYPATGQNPTDRRALGAIREAFDHHVANAAEAGLFGPRQATQAAPDGFPGAAALDTASRMAPAAGGRPERPESLIQFLGRRGGIKLDDDARAADYGRIQTGFGPLGRRNGRPIEDFRDELAAEGFIRPDDASGMISRKIGDSLHDLIGQERGGSPVYRLSETGGPPADKTGRFAAENEAFTERASNLSRQIAADLEQFGIRGRDVDPDALREASEAMALGRHADGTEAYEAALMAREPAPRPSRSAEDAPFDGSTSVATSDALPGAVPDVVDRMRKARALFSDYKRTFSPQGAGDDVGLAMRRIVDRDAEPVEVSRMLYGGNPGLNARLADRVKGIVGEDSPAWAAHQQGYLSSILNGRDMSPRAVSERIGAALSGERRGLTYRVLNDEQVAGLRQFQGEAGRAQAARRTLPDWVESLGHSDFDANRITADLFGSGVPGSRPGSAAYAGALKRFLGEDSAEWSGLRLAAWQKLTTGPDGTMLPARQLAQRITEFASGRGSGLAKQMFEPELLAEMTRFGNAVRATVRPDGTPLPNDGGTAGKLAGKAFDAIAAAIGFKIGGFAGAGAAYTARLGSKGIQGSFGARAARRSFEGGAPVIRPARTPLDLSRVGVGLGQATAYEAGR